MSQGLVFGDLTVASRNGAGYPPEKTTWTWFQANRKSLLVFVGVQGSGVVMSLSQGEILSAKKTHYGLTYLS